MTVEVVVGLEGLKIQYPQGCASSILASGTNSHEVCDLFQVGPSLLRALVSAYPALSAAFASS